VVFVYAHDGRSILHWEFFDAEQIDAAAARFEQLSAPLGEAGISTAATRAVARLQDQRCAYRVVATRGERLALARRLASDGDGDTAHQSHSLLVLEVDD